MAFICRRRGSLAKYCPDIRNNNPHSSWWGSESGLILYLVPWKRPLADRSDSPVENVAEDLLRPVRGPRGHPPQDPEAARHPE
jgi:hypothetical protein